MKQLLVQTDRCIGCKSCELACCVSHSTDKDLFAAYLGTEKPVRLVSVESNSDRSINLPVQCRQCRDPKCVSACMTGAMCLDASTGLVLNTETKCVGCWMCVMVCPYGVIVPDEQLKVAVKCDQCITTGHDPACVQSCPTKALKFMEIKDFDKSVKREFLSKFVIGEEPKRNELFEQDH